MWRQQAWTSHSGFAGSSQPDWGRGMTIPFYKSHTRVGQWICEAFWSARPVVLTFKIGVSFVKVAIDVENQLFERSFSEREAKRSWFLHIPQGSPSLYPAMVLPGQRLLAATSHADQHGTATLLLDGALGPANGVAPRRRVTPKRSFQ